MMLVSLGSHAFEDGQTIRLVNRGKSVIVKNSSLDANAEAVLWTETNVNSQRWTISEKSNGTFLLQNDYSELFLAGLTSGTAGNVGQASRTAANTKGSWDLVLIEGTTDQYRIYQGTTKRYALAAAAEATEGSALTLVNTASQTSIDTARITWTIEAVEPIARQFTKDKRDDMMEKWKARCYKKASSGWVIGGGGWWGDAEMFEIVLDALETTGDQQYATMFDNLYTNFISRNKDTWYQKGVSGYNEYNDDIAWMCIACVRAYLLTGQTKYRTTAKKNFDGMFRRADCYGNDLLQWKHNSGQGTNSCINGPAAVCACYLAIAQADTSYYQKARKTYMAERGRLFEMSNGKPTGAVWDSYDQGSGNYNKWCSTYNQGTNLGAAIMLYNHYGEQMFKDDADAIIKWSEKNLANSHGIINACQTVSGDLCGFKGIMLRYLRMYAESFDDPSHYDWIAKNAYHAWNNRNSSGITSSAWLTKAEEDFKHQEGSELKNFGNEGNMTCVSAAFNCHLGVVDSHDAYVRNEAEDFNFVRNASVVYENNEDEDGGGMAGPMRSNHYIGYRRVDFGDQPASHIELRTKITLGLSGLRVFLDQPSTTKGTLLCEIKGNELAQLKAWDTIEKAINEPVTGVHDVYFLSTGTGQTYINWWQFHSKNTVYADLTNGQGKLTASFASEDLTPLTDCDVTSMLTADIEPSDATWLQYESPSPMQLMGYQFFSGEANVGSPKGWALLASDNAENWDTLHVMSDVSIEVRGQGFSAEVTADKAYTHFRILFDMDDTQNKFTASEWQLLGRCIDQTDLTADGGTTSEGMESITDHIGQTSTESPFIARYQPAGYSKLTAYSLTASEAAKAPSAWKLEGSANGTSWKLIDQQTEEAFPFDGATNVYRVSPEDAYLHYRLTIQGEGTELTQWQLFGEPDYGTFFADITTISTMMSSDGSDALPLIDKDGTTSCTLKGEGAYWEILSPIDVKLLGYSLLCTDNEAAFPTDITIFGVDDGGTETQLVSKALSFPARGSRLTYTTSTTKLFKKFRIKASGEGESVSLAELELYGTAIAEEGDDALHMPSFVEASAEGLSRTELIDRVYDCNRSTFFHVGFTEPVSITYQFADTTDISVNAYSITAARNEITRDPSAWRMEGSNDGQTWTEIDSRSGQTFSNRYATQFYLLGEDTHFAFYRLTITDTNGADQLQVGELQLLDIQPIDPTGIAEMKSEELRMKNDNSIFDLSGRMMPSSKLRHGVYIMNGRKVVK